MSRKRNQRTFGETKNHLRESEAIWRELEAIVRRDRGSRLTGEQKYNILLLLLSIVGVIGFFGMFFWMMAK